MKKSIKRLKQNKGSVLFLVLAVMTILIIAASAVYYMVMSNRGSVQTRYDDEQAYQTALSVSNGVSEYIDAYLSGISSSSGKLNDSNDLVSAIVGLPLNGSISTTKSDASGTALASLGDYGMGEYDVTITKTDLTTSGEDTVHTYKIETTAVVDGQKVTLVQIKTITTGPAEYFTRFFTSTGKSPEDVIIDTQDIMTDVYLENDYSMIGGGGKQLKANLYATGTFVDNGVQFTGPAGTEIVIGEHFYANTSGGNAILSNGGTLMVGGNMIVHKEIGADNAYIIGDLYINHAISYYDPNIYVNGDCYINADGTKNCTFYINGDLYLNKKTQGTFYVGGNVYISSSVRTDSSPAVAIHYAGGVYDYDTKSAVSDFDTTLLTNDAPATPWADDNVMYIASDIATKTAKQNYADWQAEKYFNDNFGSAPEYTPSTIDGNWSYTISESCILRPASSWSGQWWHSIIIDASIGADGNTEPLYIYLKPEDGATSFSFGGYATTVLIKGERPVIFILPSGVDFKADRQLFVGHYEWARMIQGYADEASFDAALQSQSNTGATNITTNTNAFTTTMTSMLYSDSDYSLINVAGTNKLHNNIYLVTSGRDNVIDFNEMQCCFWGFLYAPYIKFDMVQSNNCLAFVGGMIVGTYSYENSDASLAFTSPYDYYDLYSLGDKGNITKYLMGETGSVGSDGSTIALKSWGTIGYRA